MITKEELVAKRDGLLERREEWQEKASEMRERAAEMKERAAEIKERFGEAVDGDTVTTAVGLALVSGGVAFGIKQLMSGKRGIMSLLLPMGFLVAGAALLTGGFAHQRGRHMGEVEDDIRRQLDSLDPVARVQVLTHVGRDTAPKMWREKWAES
jgi:hypothetical protein